MLSISLDAFVGGKNLGLTYRSASMANRVRSQILYGRDVYSPLSYLLYQILISTGRSDHFQEFHPRPNQETFMIESSQLPRQIDLEQSLLQNASSSGTIRSSASRRGKTTSGPSNSPNRIPGGQTPSIRTPSRAIREQG